MTATQPDAPTLVNLLDGVGPRELMVTALARLLRNGETVFHGVASPLPMVAILLARRLQAPDLVYLNITGSVDPRPERLPVSTVDPALLRGARGRAPADVDALVQVILAVARMATACEGRLAELDLNPVLVRSNGAVAVDSLVVAKEAG